MGTESFSWRMQMQIAAIIIHNMSPLSADDLEAIRCECFADDVAIPAADDATHWTRDDAIAYFESGGIAMPLPAVIPPTRHIPCVSDIQNAHSGASYDSGVTQVRLISDHGGSLTGMDGGLIAMSSSWDCRICLWRVNALGGLDPLLCELTHDDPRWVYDVAACGFYGGSLGIISTQTGGMVGEPQHLIRHWSVRRHGPQPADDVKGQCLMLPNVDGLTALGGENAPQFAHQRGVHAVDRRGRHMVTASSDALVVWRLEDAAMAHGLLPFRVAAKAAASMWSQSANTNGIRILRDERSFLPIASYDFFGGVPIFSLAPSGVAVKDVLAFKGTAANDAIELDEPGEQPRLAIATSSRALLYDRRVGTKPCARLALRNVAALATLRGSTPGEPPSLIAASDRNIYVYDVRRIPEEDVPTSAKPPPALATLLPDDEGRGPKGRGPPRWTRLDASAPGIVLAGDERGGVSAWDLMRDVTLESATSTTST